MTNDERLLPKMSGLTSIPFSFHPGDREAPSGISRNFCSLYPVSFLVMIRSKGTSFPSLLTATGLAANRGESTMFCPKCHNPMTRGTRFWTCGECGQSLPAGTADLPGTPASEDLARLPSLLALPLQ